MEEPRHGRTMVRFGTRKLLISSAMGNVLKFSQFHVLLTNYGQNVRTPKQIWCVKIQTKFKNLKAHRNLFSK